LGRLLPHRPCPPDLLVRLSSRVNPEYYVDFRRVAIYGTSVFLAGAPGLSGGQKAK
jgi:hypothetical protein